MASKALHVWTYLREGGQLGAVDGKWDRGAVGELQTHRKGAEAAWIFCSISIVFKIS